MMPNSVCTCWVYFTRDLGIYSQNQQRQVYPAGPERVGEDISVAWGALSAHPDGRSLSSEWHHEVVTILFPFLLLIVKIRWKCSCFTLCRVGVWMTGFRHGLRLSCPYTHLGGCSLMCFFWRQCYFSCPTFLPLFSTSPSLPEMWWHKWSSSSW